MGNTQLGAITKRPSWGLDYDAIIRAKAASLPALYAQTEADKATQTELNLGQDKLDLEKQNLESQKKYYEDMAGLTAEANEQAKIDAVKSTGLGLVNTGVSLYGINKMAGLTDKVTQLANGTNPAPVTMTPAVEPLKLSGDLSTEAAIVDSASAVTSTTPVAEDLGVTAGMGGAGETTSGVTAGMGGAGEGATVTGGGPTVGGIGTVLAYVAAADMVRQATGQLNEPYGERNAFAKFTSAPVTGGVPALLDIIGADESNYFAKGPNRLARVEEKIVGEPLDKAFSGDIIGSLESFASGIIDAPRDIWNATVGSIIPGADTWLCTEIARYVGITIDDDLLLQKLRRYAIKNHRKHIAEYLNQGYRLVTKINMVEVPGKFYKELKTLMLDKVLGLLRQGDFEAAYVAYRDVSYDLFVKYAPEALNIAKE